jgi:hypothetical protein
MGVTNFGMVMEEVLQIFKWTGTVVACMGVALTAEYKKFRDRFLITRGK